MVDVLKGIPAIISPELIKVLMEMGHGDEIVLADGNFPAASKAQRLVRCDGHNVADLLEAILKYFPLDTYVKKPVALMEVVAGDPIEPVVWKKYQNIIKKYNNGVLDIEYLERFEFYSRASRAYVIVTSSEMALYANIILKKGVVSG